MPRGMCFNLPCIYRTVYIWTGARLGHAFVDVVLSGEWPLLGNKEWCCSGLEIADPQRAPRKCYKLRLSMYFSGKSFAERERKKVVRSYKEKVYCSLGQGSLLCCSVLSMRQMPVNTPHCSPWAICIRCVFIHKREQTLEGRQVKYFNHRRHSSEWVSWEWTAKHIEGTQKVIPCHILQLHNRVGSHFALIRAKAGLS